MIRILCVLVLLITVPGCFSLKSPHGQFIGNMNATIIVATRKKATINDLSSDTYLVSKKYLRDIEKLDVEYDKYHYKLPKHWGDCYYYFLVDRSTNIPVDWGFDEHLGDPTETCGSSG